MAFGDGADTMTLYGQGAASYVCAWMNTARPRAPRLNMLKVAADARAAATCARARARLRLVSATCRAVSGPVAPHARVTRSNHRPRPRALRSRRQRVKSRLGGAA